MGNLKFRKKIVIFLIPAVVLYFVFSIYPFFRTFLYSFTDWNGFTTSNFTALQNYTKILSDKYYIRAIGRIFIWAVLSIIFKVGMALVIAYVLRKGFRGIRFFRAVVFLPYLISSSAMALIFTIMYDKEIGIINLILKLIGLESLTRYWLGDVNTVFYAIIAIPIYQAIGYFFVILYAAMKDVPEELYEAAKLDGAGPVKVFSRVTIPCIWPTLVVCIVLAINGAFNNFDYIFIVSQGGPNHSSEVPAVYMYRQIFENGKYGLGAAAAIIQFILTTLVTGLLRLGLNKVNRTE